jgi:hypothetical protein
VSGTVEGRISVRHRVGKYIKNITR